MSKVQGENVFREILRFCQILLCLEVHLLRRGAGFHNTLKQGEEPERLSWLNRPDPVLDKQGELNRLPFYYSPKDVPHVLSLTLKVDGG